MDELQSDWFYVRDGQRELRLQVCDSWERVTLLASLSSDPHSLEELAIAWSRYRPNEPLLEMAWEPAVAPRPEALSIGIDLARQVYFWNDPEPIDANAGGMQVTIDDDCSPDCDTGKKMVAWLNVPPWWRRIEASGWLSIDGDDQETATDTHRNGLDYRQVLYGRPLVEFIADRVGRVGREQSANTELDFKACDKLTVRMHADWLMTCRDDLGGATPRNFLHLHRSWKEKELDFRRSQWAKERRPPPSVSQSSYLFQLGPAGTEELVTYYELCRQLFRAAWLCVNDDRNIEQAALIAFLELTRDSWMDEPAPELDGCTPQQVIDIERQLMPRESSGDPIDCDCPLCRMHSLEPELFGPSFSICDGFQLEMEDEFAFSLITERDLWEVERVEWRQWDDDSNLESTDAEANEKLAGQADATLEAPECPEGQWGEVWESSYVAPTPAGVSLSLFAIGARLSEMIGDLQLKNADRSHIDSLNRAFDGLGRAIRAWLVEEATAAESQLGENTESAVNQMIGSLEAVAVAYPELTAKSADLQSLVHHWQRQLTLQ